MIWAAGFFVISASDLFFFLLLLLGGSASGQGAVASRDEMVHAKGG
jgi:hypothetical protein